VKKQKIIIADNSKHFREGLKKILLNIGNVKLVGEVENGIQLMELMGSQKADIVFLDANMPEMNGFEAAMIGHRKYPHTRFIAFTSLENQRYVNKMMVAGAEGYLTKSSDNYDLLSEIVLGNKNQFILSSGLQSCNVQFDN